MWLPSLIPAFVGWPCLSPSFASFPRSFYFFKKTRACVAKKILLFGQHLFFNITDFSCAKKRVRHAYICPTTVIGQPVLKFYPPPPQIVSAAAKTFKIPGGKLRFSALKFRAKMACTFWTFFSEILSTNRSRGSRLSQTTSHPTRLIRPRPIDCDRVSEQPVTIFLLDFYCWNNASNRIFFNGYLI